MSENESNGQREHHDGGGSGAGSSNENKRIRLSDPDLQITCKNGDKERTLEYHSIQMALQSKYFDNLLSSGMAESATKKVVLDDVDPDLFAEAMSLIESPAKFSGADITTIMKVASLYDRFEFKNGLESVDIRAGKALDTLRTKLVSQKLAILSTELDQAISIILFGDTSNSSILVAKGKELLEACFKSQDLNGLGCFNERRVKALQPFLSKNRQLLELAYSSQIAELDDEDIKSLSFPKFLSCHFDHLLNQNYYLKLPLTLQVRLSIPAQNGDPEVESTTFLLKPAIESAHNFWCTNLLFGCEGGRFLFMRILPKPSAEIQPDEYDAGGWAAMFFPDGPRGRTYIIKYMSNSTKSVLPPEGSQWHISRISERDVQSSLKGNLEVKHLWGNGPAET